MFVTNSVTFSKFISSLNLDFLLYTHGYEEYLPQKAAKQMPCVVPDTVLNKCPYHGNVTLAQLSISLAR